MRKNWNFYLILDTEVKSYRELLDIAQKASLSGVDIVQLRDKKGSARNILQFCKDLKKVLKNKIPFIVNDRVDIASAVKASGVHIGQDDIPIGVARKILGPAAIIGVSCQTLEHAQKAQSQGADYIGFGSVFATLTKPNRKPINLNLLAEVVKETKIPVFAIGGINAQNIRSLRVLGVKRVAVCRAICEANNVAQAARSIKKALQDY